MKGITYCGACADYDIKKHRRKRGAKLESNPQDKFFDDCPLPDAVPVVHGRWKLLRKGDWTSVFVCSVCGRRETIAESESYNSQLKMPRKYPYCHCGARMDGDDDAKAD